MHRSHGVLVKRRQPRRTKVNNTSESHDQIRLCNWMDDNNILYYAIYNEGKRSIGAAIKAVSMGLRSGVPDLCLPIARNGYHGMYLELKRSKGGRISPNQEIWIKALTAQGYYVVVAKGYSCALNEICKYMGINYVT